MDQAPATPPIARTLAAGELLEALDRLDLDVLRAWLDQVEEAERIARAVFAAKLRHHQRQQRQQRKKAVPHA
jgi:hypothetical protein